jgi:hypothetical protein
MKMHTKVTWATLVVGLVVSGNACAQQAAAAAPAVFGAPIKLATTQATAAGTQGAASVASPATTKRWDVLTTDVTLTRTLERWAAIAGYRLKWDAGRNFLISAPSTFEGTFEVALAEVLGTPGIRLSDYPLEACIYGNTPPLVRITRQGQQTRECTAASN